MVAPADAPTEEAPCMFLLRNAGLWSCGASELCWHLLSEREPWNNVYIFNRSLLATMVLLLWFPFINTFLYIY